MNKTNTQNEPSTDARFSELLTAPLHGEKPYRWNEREARENEIYISALNLIENFVDHEQLLKTATDDFKEFLAVSEIRISKNGLPFTLRVNEHFEKEEYSLDVTQESIILTGGDIEGLRRGLIFTEDEMKRRAGSFLPLGTIRRKPFIKRRISRCYFTPPSHASGEGHVNELLSDIDYYPDEYLNRLAHDGINGLWLGASFRDLLKSEIIPEYGRDSEKMLKKLREVVEKCRRYGIGIYLFSVEPASIYNNPSLEKHTELLGGYGWGGGNRMFCISTEDGEKYLREAIEKLFTSVKNLAGFINITAGECLSACGSDVSFNCPRCKKKFGSHARALAATESIIAEALEKANPSAEFISWTYAQRSWDIETVKECCNLRDNRVIHMQNFEDLGHPIQLGEERLAIDYWLSYVGPGDVMRSSLEINKQRKIRTFAKIQSASSHEISTVPYVPAPGILYDKFKIMRDESIEGVMLCWYFGNYPCLMNKAASELSFEPYMSTKLDFLRHISGIYFGEDGAKVAKVFEKIEEGYKNYPVSVSFEWYGPMQDSPAVPLHLIPKDIPMSETWLSTDSDGGDRIGEALLDGHRIDEAIELAARMCESVKCGADILSSLPGGTYEREEIQSVTYALSILFQSGYNRLKFYNLRHSLALTDTNGTSILDDMRKIVIEEILLSENLAALCKKDIRLGYHSEAHGYKFTEQNLKRRIDRLKILLETEFPEVKKRIKDNLPPLLYYLGEGEGLSRYVINSGDIRPFASGNTASKTSFSAYEKNGIITLRFLLEDPGADILTVNPEFHLFHPTSPFILKNGEISLPDNNNYSNFGNRAEKKRNIITCRYENAEGFSVYSVDIDREKLGILPNEPIRISAVRRGAHNETLLPHSGGKSRLIFGTSAPSDYLFIISDKFTSAYSSTH